MTANAIPNDLTPPMPPMPANLTAVERVMRTVDWATQRLHERGRLKKAEREVRALAYEASAAGYAKLAEQHPAMLEFAGLHAFAAKLMRTGD